LVVTLVVTKINWTSKGLVYRSPL